MWPSRLLRSQPIWARWPFVPTYFLDSQNFPVHALLMNWVRCLHFGVRSSRAVSTWMNNSSTTSRPVRWWRRTCEAKRPVGRGSLPNSSPPVWRCCRIFVRSPSPGLMRRPVEFVWRHLSREYWSNLPNAGPRLARTSGRTTCGRCGCIPMTNPHERRFQSNLEQNLFCVAFAVWPLDWGDEPLLESGVRP